MKRLWFNDLIDEWNTRKMVVLDGVGKYVLTMEHYSGYIDKDPYHSNTQRYLEDPLNPAKLWYLSFVFATSSINQVRDFIAMKRQSTCRHISRTHYSDSKPNSPYDVRSVEKQHMLLYDLQVNFIRPRIELIINRSRCKHDSHYSFNAVSSQC